MNSAHRWELQWASRKRALMLEIQAAKSHVKALILRFRASSCKDNISLKERNVDMEVTAEMENANLALGKIQWHHGTEM